MLVVQPERHGPQGRPRRGEDDYGRGHGQGAGAAHARRRSSSSRSIPITRTGGSQQARSNGWRASSGRASRRRRSMRALILPAAALALAGAVVLVGGRMVEGPAGMSRRRRSPTRKRLPLPEAAASTLTTAPVADACAEAAAEPSPMRSGQASRSAGSPHRPPAQSRGGRMPAVDRRTSRPTSRLVAPAMVAPPDLAADELQREAPREPLSQLSLALPPKPEMKNEWAGTPFFRPVATAVGSLRVDGPHRSRSPASKACRSDESCDYEGVSWPCGVGPAPPSGCGCAAARWSASCRDEEQAVTSRQMPPRQAGCRRLAGGERLGARCARRSYVQAEEKARAAEDGHLRRAAGHLVDLGCRPMLRRARCRTASRS